MEQLQKQLDPVKFAEELLTYQGKPLRLYQFQKDFLRQIDWLHDRVAIQKGRAIGASFVCAIGLTFAAWLHDDARFCILSKTEQQSGFIFAHVKRFYETSPILRDYIDRQKTCKDELHLTNGSVVVHRTMGARGDTLRGFHTENRGGLVIDEGSSCPSDAITTCYPSAVGSAIIHVSTPKQPSGEFWRVCTQDPDFRVIRLPSTISPRITKRDLELWKRIYPPSRYRNEVLGEFAAGEDCVFDAASIDRAIDRDLPLFHPDYQFSNYDREKNYYMSLDVSKHGGDRWYLTIGEVKIVDGIEILVVVAYHSWVGSIHTESGYNATVTDNPEVIIRDILWYAQRFWPLKVYVDVTANPFFGWTLANKHRLPVEEIHWSTQSKERMVEHLATCLRANKIKIPDDQEMIGELQSFSYDRKKMEDQTDRILYLGGGDDDAVSSLCQLSLAISIDTGDEFFEMIEVF